ncbi:MAG: phenylalanine--tRNA ligase subunit beta [Phycisphaeraceae bacterium]
MKTSIAWLNDYLDRPCELDAAEQLLTAVGFPIDGREDVALPDGSTETILEVEVTSNRGDCLSHVGLARELAAASRSQFRPPTIDPGASSGDDVASLTSVDNTDTTLCPLYTARVITGVRVGPSPDWLVQRLAAVGLRSVNNVVDATNYVLFELGQPLHAFDLAALADRRIVVRPARGGERFTAIDGSNHELNEDMLVIADARRPVAIAGVMGGLDSEVGGNTRDILIESAIFDPLSVRSTSRALKLASDSSFRFERGVDPLGVDRASQRAAQIILQIAGGQLAPGVVRVGRDDPQPLELTLRAGRCSGLLGIDLTPQTQADHLDRLGLSPRVDGEQIACRVPSHRLDLKREVDLIEEVARLHGLGRIPMRDRIEIQARPIQPHVAARQTLGRVLAAHGYHETITFSFVSVKQGGAFLTDGTEAVMVDDERRKAEPMLRPSLLPSLLACRKANQDRGNTGLRLFETAATWRREGGRLTEHRRLGLLADATGDAQAALRDLRAAVEELIEHLAGPAARQRVDVESVNAPNFAAAGQVRLGEHALGSLGVVADDTRDRFDVKTPLVAAELDLDALIALYPPARHATPQPRYPAIERDLSIIVDESVRWRDIAGVVDGVKPAMLEGVRFLDTYRGKPIAAGRKSISFRMIFRDPDRTLRHDQVDPQVQAVVDALTSADDISAELRT